MIDFVMPSLGADMQAGTLVAFRRQPGQSIARGEILAEVETEKGVIEIECFTPGVIEALCATPGQKLPVGARLASIREGVQSAAAAATMPVTAQTPVADRSPAASVLPAPSPATVSSLHASPAVRRMLRDRAVDLSHVHGSGRAGTITHADVTALQPRPAPSVSAPTAGVRTRISPLARRLAQERNLTVASLSGSGPGGYVVAADVLRVTDTPAPGMPQPAASSGESPMRMAIAQAMSRSKREIPHYYLSQTVDLSNSLAWLRSENEKRGVAGRLLAGVLLVRAVARALHKTPELNAYFVDGRSQPQAHVHVGVAVSLRDGGLVAPAILDADTLTIDQLSRAFTDLVTRARGGRLRSSEMAAATITITSLGERGVETVFPIIVPPQVAMVGFGAIADKPMASAGAVVVRPTINVTLAADHRVSDGHRGGLLLSAIRALLEEAPTP